MRTSQSIIPNAVLTLIVLIIAGFSASSQDTIAVKTEKALMSKGMQTCYFVEIPQADLKTVQQNWIKKIQENNKVKVQESGQELILSGVVKSEITNDSLNIYSLLIQEENRIILHVFIENDTVFFTPSEDRADLSSAKIDSSIKNYLRSFAVDQYRIAVEDELEMQEKTLKTMQNDLEKMVKEEENLKKDISSYENDIDEKEREITELENSITLKNQEIATHQASMQTIALESDKKAALDKQKQLEKEKKDLEKERSKAKNNISDYKAGIEKNNKAIEQSKEDQSAKQQEITNQTTVVNQVQTKLDGIK